MVGNGFCNDETNNPNCNYDGGDCCGMNANTNFCSECVCHLIETCKAGYHPLVGNGFCDDDTNVEKCDYDGGDCCEYSFNSDHCTECTCFHLETCLNGLTHAFVADGICNDETNIAGCNYDGGDCCGYNINSEHCNECTCFHQETCIAGLTHAFVGDGVCNKETNIGECNYDGGDCCSNPEMVSNSVCNDETNIVECNYDGGDCCVNVNADSCSNCDCLASGVITSPGFPGSYNNNLDLTWLIQVQMGHRIETNFLSFDVEYDSTCMWVPMPFNS